MQDITSAKNTVNHDRQIAFRSLGSPRRKKIGTQKL